MYILKDERSKLSVKTRKIIFLGYNMDDFNYRLYDLINKKLVIRQEILFIKDQTTHDVKKIQYVVF